MINIIRANAIRSKWSAGWWKQFDEAADASSRGEPVEHVLCFVCRQAPLPLIFPSDREELVEQKEAA